MRSSGLLPWHAGRDAGSSRNRACRVGILADGELAQRDKLVREELAETIALNDKLERHRRVLWRNCSL